MTHQTQTFTIADPRTFDGDPYEVAERAVAQAEALVKLSTQAVYDAWVMARNAELERQIVATGEPNATEFEQGIHGRKFADLITQFQEAQTTLAMLRRSAAFNPKGKLDG